MLHAKIACTEDMLLVHPRSSTANVGLLLTSIRLVDGAAMKDCSSRDAKTSWGISLTATQFLAIGCNGH
eukprot:4793021-Prorocentrum_lima.AAC.1